MGTRFIFWCTSPVLLAFIICMPFLVTLDRTETVTVLVALEIAAFLLLLGLYDFTSYAWCFRVLGALVFATYCCYLIDMLKDGGLQGDGRRSSANAVNALLGMIAFGVPGLWFALTGRLTLRPESNSEYETLEESGEIVDNDNP